MKRERTQEDEKKKALNVHFIGTEFRLLQASSFAQELGKIEVVDGCVRRFTPSHEFPQDNTKRPLQPTEININTSSSRILPLKPLPQKKVNYRIKILGFTKRGLSKE